jgi:sugar lactone lactonase YvrE
MEGASALTTSHNLTLRWCWRVILACLLLLVSLGPVSGAGAQLSPIDSYTIDARGYRVPIPKPYVLDLVVNGIDVGSGPLKSPSDLFVDGDDNLFVVDTDNDRVLKFDRELRLMLTIGEDLDLKRPQGIFVSPDGNLFIADTGNQRIVHADSRGRFIREYLQPETPLLEQRRTGFRPTKLTVDQRGYIYILEEGLTSGIILLDVEATFRGFFGSTRVGFDPRRLLISLVATEEQKQQIFLPEPTPHSNLFLTPDGFLYTVVTGATSEQVQKLNPVGVNVYGAGLLARYAPFGELEKPGQRAVAGASPVSLELDESSFIDVAVDRFGIVTVIDSGNGRVYQYDQSRRLLAVFGGLGDGPEQFQLPESIAVDSQGRIFVADKARNTVSRLIPTRFIQFVHEASQLYFDGQYEEAVELWQEVLRLDARYEVAHIGLGKAHLRQEDYQSAMAEFRLASDRLGYSKAFGEHRHEWLTQNFGLLTLAFAVLLTAIITLTTATRRLAGRVRWGMSANWLRPVAGILGDPIETFWELRERGSLWAVPVLLLLACVVRLLSPTLMAFHMVTIPQVGEIWNLLTPYNLITYYHLRELDPDQVNILLEIARVIGPWALWVVVSYGVGIIFEGEGSFRALLITSAYCLVPYILFMPPALLVTHVLTQDNRGLLDFVFNAIYLWCAVLFFIQTRTIHDFEFGRTVRMVATMAFGMAVLFGFVGLLYLIGSQMVHFAWEVLYETRVL